MRGIKPPSHDTARRTLRGLAASVIALGGSLCTAGLGARASGPEHIQACNFKGTVTYTRQVPPPSTQVAPFYVLNFVGAGTCRINGAQVLMPAVYGFGVMGGQAFGRLCEVRTAIAIATQPAPNSHYSGFGLDFSFASGTAEDHLDVQTPDSLYNTIRPVPIIPVLATAQPEFGAQSSGAGTVYWPASGCLSETGSTSIQVFARFH